MGARKHERGGKQEHESVEGLRFGERNIRCLLQEMVQGKIFKGMF